VFKESLLNLLSSTHEDVKRNLLQMRKEGNSPVPKLSPKNSSVECDLDSTCPYCNKELNAPPKKKKKCSMCGNFIYVRSSRVLFPSTCLTEDEAFATDEFYYLKEYGLEKEDFFAKNRIISDKMNGKGAHIETCISIYEELLLEKTEDTQLQILYFRIALLNYKLGRDFISHLQHAAKMQLKKLKQYGHKHVKISSMGCCDVCQKLDGGVLTIEEALKEKPVPCLECTHEVEKGKLGWCICHYEPIIGSDESER
jgi:hypothetical protein